MSIEHAFVAHEILHHKTVELNTWGHLKPKSTEMLSFDFAHAEYGDNGVVILSSTLHGSLKDSPFLYEAMQNLADNFSATKLGRANCGCVFRFTGTARTTRNGTIRLVGRKVQITRRVKETP